MEQSGEQEESQNEKTISLGIDFGNSKISSAIWNNKNKGPEMVLIDGKPSFPSTVYCTGISNKREEGSNEEGGENPSSRQTNISISAEAGVEFDENKNLENYITDIKRFIGQKNTNEELGKIIVKYKIDVDENDNIVCSLFNEKIQFEFIAKFLFEKIKDLAEKQYNSKVYACTISIPNGFNSTQREAIENAAKLAGIRKVFIIHDPLSTLIYYSFKEKCFNKNNENILVIDFGSSKLDITILERNEKNKIKVIATGGDSNLGGDIFNEEIRKEVLQLYKDEGGIVPEEQDPDRLIKIHKLDKEVEKVKKELTFKDEAHINLEKFDDKKDLKYTTKIEVFNEMNAQNYKNIIELIDKVLIESEIPPQDIKTILLQGDALRVKKLKELIKNKYPDSDIVDNKYEAVAQGAAIHVAYKLGLLKENPFGNFKIYDIIPLSLGIRGEGDLMSVILKRGCKVPSKVKKYYITTQDNQTSIKFEIYTGERKLVKDNIPLAKIILKGLPQKNKGQVRIEIIFEVDENFVLHVNATEESTKTTSQCHVYINGFLTQNQILEKVEEAKIHKEEDQMELERIQSRLKLNDKIFEYNHLYEGNEDILRELESYRNWIKHSSTVPKEEYEKKLKELIDTMQKDKTENKGRKQNMNNTAKKNINKTEEEKNPESK